MILCLHNISTYSYPLPAQNDISIDHFKRLIIDFLKHGWEFLSPEEYFETYFRKKILLTFDDGYFDQYLIVKNFLRPLGISALLFITASMVGENWRSTEGIYIRGIKEEEVKNLINWGYTIGSHGFQHLIFESKKDWEEDVKISLDNLEKMTGKKIKYYSFPFGFYKSSFSEEFLRSYGIEKVFILGEKKLFLKNSFFLNRVPVRPFDNHWTLLMKNIFYRT